MLSDTWCFFLCCCIKEVKSKDNKEEKAKAACNCIREWCGGRQTLLSVELKIELRLEDNTMKKCSYVSDSLVF